MSEDTITEGMKKLPGNIAAAERKKMSDSENTADMKITVKSHLNRYELYTEPEERLLSRICRRLCGGKRMDVFNADNRPEASVWQENETLYVAAGGETLSCPLKYREDAEGKRIQESLVRPPMPVEIRFRIRQGELSVVQAARRDFEVFLDGQKIIEMSRMLRRTKQLLVLSDVLPEEYYGVLFALAMLMLHDDDVEIV